MTRYGIPNCTGEYVTFLDYDNKFPPTYIRKVVELSVRNNSRFIFTRASLIDSGGQRLGRNLCNVPNDYADLKRLVMRNYVDTNRIVIHSNVLKGLLPELRLLDSEFYDWIWEAGF
ncbi:glycosyltransferase family 2 protein [Candidatus Bathyarchaeota archaeon]|nr:glycosyltransferase family 2 protein [Candidatus Bathyarchaeota archaeon]